MKKFELLTLMIISVGIINIGCIIAAQQIFAVTVDNWSFYDPFSVYLGFFAGTFFVTFAVSLDVLLFKKWLESQSDHAKKP